MTPDLDIPCDRPVALLLRHAERPLLGPHDVGLHTPLTAAGTLQAEALGRTLAPVLKDIHTSPILRARATAEALARGAGRPLAITDDRLLGDPGIFVADPSRAWANWLAHGADGMLALLADPHPLPGLRDPTIAAHRLAAHLVEHCDHADPGIHAFITHDALLIPLLATTWQRPLPPSLWPEFLAPVALWRDGAGLRLHYGGRTVAVPPARPLITVLIVTHDRPALLHEAVRSVLGQRVDADVELLIVGDTSPSLESMRDDLSVAVQILNIPREREFPSTSARLGNLRNLGIQHAAGDWIAFLDDDNRFTPDHLATLLATAIATGAPAVHSHRLLLEPDGAAWAGTHFLWPTPGLDYAAALRWLTDEGVLAPPVMRDRTSLYRGYPGTVDTSEWLVRRRTCLEIPWPDDVHLEDESAGISEDGVWLRRLVAAHVPIACSERATLLFRLGGRFETLRRPTR